jgi:hypothetical protein
MAYTSSKLDEPQEIDSQSTIQLQHAGTLETDPTFNYWMAKLADIRRSASK